MAPGYRIEKLEYNVANGCILRCDQCDHLAPFFGACDAEFSSSITPENFARQLALLKPHLHAGSFWILGGEPLLQERILEFLARLRESGITDQIGLFTNGLLLANQPDALFQSVDKITISRYASRPISKEAIGTIRRRCEAAGVELGFFWKTHFRKTIVGERNSNSRQVNSIFQTCANAWSWHCHVIQDGYLYRCSIAPLLGYKLHQQGLAQRDFHEDDGLKLEDSPGFADRIRAYLESSTPLKSCSYCLGCVGRRIEHRQMSKEEVDQQAWTRGTIANGIDRWKLFQMSLRWRLLGQR